MKFYSSCHERVVGEYENGNEIQLKYKSFIAKIPIFLRCMSPVVRTVNGVPSLAFSLYTLFLDTDVLFRW